MKDGMQNLTDLIGALAEDIEAIKTKLDEKVASDKDEAVKRLAMKLEPLIRFAGGKAIDNINDIFWSEESIAAYRKSLGDEMLASLQANLEADEKDRRKRGIPTMTELLISIRKMLVEHIEGSKHNTENAQQNQRQTKGFLRFPKFNAISKWVKFLWCKIPDGWYKNPYAWTGIFVMLLFVALSVVSWVQWHQYREENIRLRIAADKHRVATSIVQKLHPSLAVTIAAYEELVETAGVDSTLAVFHRQLEKMRNNETNTKQEKSK